MAYAYASDVDMPVARSDEGNVSTSRDTGSYSQIFSMVIYKYPALSKDATNHVLRAFSANIWLTK